MITIAQAASLVLAHVPLNDRLGVIFDGLPEDHWEKLHIFSSGNMDTGSLGACMLDAFGQVVAGGACLLKQEGSQWVLVTRYWTVSPTYRMVDLLPRNFRLEYGNA